MYSNEIEARLERRQLSRRVLLEPPEGDYPWREHGKSFRNHGLWYNGWCPPGLKSVVVMITAAAVRGGEVCWPEGTAAALC